MKAFFGSDYERGKNDSGFRTNFRWTRKQGLIYKLSGLFSGCRVVILGNATDCLGRSNQPSYKALYATRRSGPVNNLSKFWDIVRWLEKVL